MDHFLEQRDVEIAEVIICCDKRQSILEGFDVSDDGFIGSSIGLDVTL